MVYGRNTQEQSADPVIEMIDLAFSADVEGRFIMTPEMAERWLGTRPESPEIVRLQDIFVREEADAVDALLQHSTSASRRNAPQNHILRDQSGRLVRLSVSGFTASGPQGVFCTLETIEHGNPGGIEAKLPGFDDGIGFPSREMALEHLRRKMEQTPEGEPGQCVHIVGLKTAVNINTILGYRAGDELLREAGSRLRNLVGSRGYVARFVGNAFIIISECEGDRLDRHLTPGALIACFDQPVRIANKPIYVAASIGLAKIAHGMTDPELCIRQAELALQEATRNDVPVVQFDSAMLERANRKAQLEQELREAFEYDGFELMLQPKVDLLKQDCVGFEALIRWHHPDHGLIYPQAFIPTAEETGLIVPITDWVIAEACQLIRRQIDAGQRPLPISINVPPCQLIQREARDFVKIVKAHRIPAELLEIEITESAEITEVKRALNTLKDLNAAGMKIAIDDFGTGYSSLARLGSMPVNVLKIDHSFIVNLPWDQKACDVVSSISILAAALDLDIVAEGVETREQAEFLQKSGVKIAQGFLYAPAVTASEAFAEAAAVGQ